MAHYLGKGVSTHNGLGPEEYDKIKKHTMKSAKRVSTSSENRGLATYSAKLLERCKVGPGSYGDTKN